MSLAAFQAEFAAYLCGTADAPPGPPDRATIYRNNVRLSLTAALAANFPVTRAMVGDDYFHQAARRFIRDHLPLRPDMADYGREFPSFLATLADLTEYPFLPDVARTERAMIEALLAPHTPPLTAETLAAVPPDEFAGLRFDAHPSTRLVRSSYAIVDLWSAHQEQTPDLSGLDPQRPQAMLIARPDDQVSWSGLDPEAGKFTSALLSGETIVEAMTRVREDFDLTSTLLQALQSGIFTGLTLSKNQ